MSNFIGNNVTTNSISPIGTNTDITITANIKGVKEVTCDNIVSPSINFIPSIQSNGAPNHLTEKYVLGSWVNYTSNGVSQGVQLHSMIPFNGRLYSLGGTTSLTATLNNLVSDDGVTWNSLSAPFGLRTGMATAVFQDKLWVICGTNGNQGTYYNDVWYSSDGSTWTNYTSTGLEGADTPACVVFNGKLWIFGGEKPSPNTKIFNSSDGLTWTEVVNNISSLGFPSLDKSTAVIFNKSLWLIADSGAVLNSTDGITWIVPTLSGFATTLFAQGGVPRAIVYGNKIIVFANNVCGYSYDGINWTSLSINPPVTYIWNAVAIFNDNLIVYGGFDGATSEVATMSRFVVQRDGFNRYLVESPKVYNIAISGSANVLSYTFPLTGTGALINITVVIRSASTDDCGLYKRTYLISPSVATYTVSAALSDITNLPTSMSSMTMAVNISGATLTVAITGSTTIAVNVSANMELVFTNSAYVAKV